MRFQIVFLLVFMFLLCKYSIGDSTNKKDTSNLKHVDSEQIDKNISYQRILLDSNSILRIVENYENPFWSFNKLLPIGIALFSVTISIITLVVTRRKFKREHLINLFNYWEAVNDINPSDPIFVDVRNAINALTLTSIIWNYEIIDRRIIYSSHWDAFKQLYETIINCHIAPKNSYKQCSMYITKDITKTYDEMSKYKK